MTKILPTRLVLSLTLLVLAPATTLHAQATKIFVASYGNDANDGSRGSPKRNFQAAHDAVAADGQIVVLDTAGYGALAITKGLSVTVPPGVNGFVTIGSGDAITINTGAGVKVSLRGLIVEGPGSGTTNGILITSAGAVALEDCTIRRLSKGVFANTSTPLKLDLANCVVRDCTTGLDVETTAAVALVAVATGCRVERCGNNGFSAEASTGASVDATLSDCTITGNNGSGVIAFNAGTVVRVEGSRIVGNTNGIVVSGGQVLSRVNNTVERNGTLNAFPANSTYSAK